MRVLPISVSIGLIALAGLLSCQADSTGKKSIESDSTEKKHIESMVGETEEISSKTERVDLGGGYRNAKWGMTDDQVRAAIEGRIIRDGPHMGNLGSYLEIKIGNRRYLYCWFYKNRFYKADLRPFYYDDGQREGVELVYKALHEKYGSGTVITNRFTEGYSKIPLKVLRWDDGTTQIECQMWDATPSTMRKHNIYSYPSTTLKVIYTCKAIVDEIMRNEKAAEEAYEQKKAERLRSVGKDL